MQKENRELANQNDRLKGVRMEKKALNRELNELKEKFESRIIAAVADDKTRLQQQYAYEVDSKSVQIDALRVSLEHEQQLRKTSQKALRLFNEKYVGILGALRRELVAMKDLQASQKAAMQIGAKGVLRGLAVYEEKQCWH
jgi:hypothetical protein